MENRYKNSFHIEPSKGLLNDPNGLIQFDGKYYFFHQWNRFEMNHSYKEWRLVVSDNLVNWESRESALLPDCLEDKDGVYSGSAIEHDNQLILFYTGNTKQEGVRKSYQRIAVSTDGKTFIKQPNTIETPVGITEHHRDPKVWKYQNEWWMIVGAQTEERVGAITLFRSRDLFSWDYQGIVFMDASLEQMCECPDYFVLNDTVEILTACPQERTPFEDDVQVSSYSGYYIGTMNYELKQFIPQTAIQPFDYGFDFYAPQTFLDEKKRRIIVGWMSRMNEEQEMNCPTKEFGYIHCLTMPRELKWVNNQLHQVPLEELKQLRQRAILLSPKAEIHRNKVHAYEINVEFQQSTNEFYLQLNSNDTCITYANHELSVSRKSWVTDTRETKVLKTNELNNLQVFCDSSTVELFINDGQYVFSMRAFSTLENSDIKFKNKNENYIVKFYPFEEEK